MPERILLAVAALAALVGIAELLHFLADLLGLLAVVMLGGLFAVTTVVVGSGTDLLGAAS